MRKQEHHVNRDIFQSFIRNDWFVFATIIVAVATLVGFAAWIIQSELGCGSLAISENCLNAKTHVFTTLGWFIVALAGICAWCVAQWRENDRRRFETFFKMQEEFRTNPRFGKIFDALNKKVKLCQISNEDAEELASFLEEVAILVQSNVLSTKLVHYLFGYYTIQIVECEEFMEKIGANDTKDTKYIRIYWSLLRYFAELMKTEQGKLTDNPKIASRLRI